MYQNSILEQEEKSLLEKLEEQSSKEDIFISTSDGSFEKKYEGKQPFVKGNDVKKEIYIFEDFTVIKSNCNSEEDLDLQPRELGKSWIERAHSAICAPVKPGYAGENF